MMLKASHCPLCDSQDLFPFLYQSHIPVHQNVIFKTSQAARAVEKGSLDLRACCECECVFNAAFDPAKISYNQDYDNTQAYSDYFDAYLDELVSLLIEKRNVRNAAIVEVGCGKGNFLKKLIHFPESNNRGYGFDPTYVGPEVDCEGRAHFKRSFYAKPPSLNEIDAVICRHVIEHVPHPRELIEDIAKDLSPKSQVFFETPNLSWIIKNQVIWDFFYEHCVLFTPFSMQWTFEASGLEIRQIKNVFEGQYMWVEGGLAQTKRSSKTSVNTQFLQQLKRFRNAYELSLVKLKNLLRNLKQEGPIALWGAGAKGVTLCNLVDQEEQLIDAVIDLNRSKQGRFIAGTGHSIFAPEEIRSRGIRSILIMNPNYFNEIESLIQGQGIDIRLIHPEFITAITAI